MTELNISHVVVGLLATAVAWLFKSHIQQGKDIVGIQTALKIYFEGTAKGAAKVLDSPNPTPPAMRQLLRKYYEHQASESECQELKAWLRGVVDDPKSPKSERSAAIDILSAWDAMKILFPARPKHGHH
jgi:hypothetical protein